MFCTSFSIVLSLGGFLPPPPQVKDQTAALRNIHRLLRPGGEALLVFLAKNPIFDAYRRMAAGDKWASVMKVDTFIEKKKKEYMSVRVPLETV